MTDEDARKLLGAILDELRKRAPPGVIAELELHMAEGVVTSGAEADGRRRRATNLDGLQVVLRFLHERIVVPPLVAASALKSLSAKTIVFRPDTTLVERDFAVQAQTGDMADLHPESSRALLDLFQPLREVLDAPEEVVIEEES